MKQKTRQLNSDDVLLIEDSKLWLIVKTKIFLFKDFLTAIPAHLGIHDEHKMAWLKDGVECKVLAPKHDWQPGKIRIKIEFIPDEIEEDIDSQQNANVTTDSSLDEIRQRIKTEPSQVS
ncbi:MAG: KGK domain-containing protein [Leptolyngbyaceae bacterium]|nr:KGK domain-containing protein [Leptolyngbyaceae bacterium]